MEERPETPEQYRRILETTLGIPFTEGNRLRVLRNGVEIFPAMLDAIRQARISIEFLTFIYWRGDVAWQFADSLAERARAGVEVRLILDAIGAWLMPREMVRRMEDAGVRIVWFRPPVRWKVWEADNRTHRKVLVCDGRIAFTGGVGIAEEWEGDARNPDEWRDTHFQIEGPGVHGLQAAFIDNWAEAGLPVYHDITHITDLSPKGEAQVQVLRATASINWSDIATMMHLLLTLARRRIRIATAYFVPDGPLLDALMDAAERGVEVEIIMPGPHTDHRLAQLAQEDEYLPLLESGVRIYRYQPTMFHTKAVLVDDTVACVGSANFNQRSMSKDDEVNMVLIDPPTLRILDRQYDEDLQQCVEMDGERLHEQGLVHRAARRMVNLFRQEM